MGVCVFVQPKKKEKSLLAYDWKPGDPCRAIWADNGKWESGLLPRVRWDN